MTRQQTFRGLTLLLMCCFVACRPAANPSGQGGLATGPGTPRVAVVNYPLEYFASRIGGDLVEVQFPVPPDVDPAFWQPTDEAITQFQNADVILFNGAGYAKWTQRISLPEARGVDTSKAFADQLIRIDEGVVHTHGPGGEHTHQGFAFTTWIDPRLALAQAEAVHQALSQLLPQHAATLTANFAGLKEDLEQLDRQLEVIAGRYQGEPLLGSHPVYQYLARRCGWKMRSVHWEPEEIPAAEQWDAIGTLLETHPSKWMLWEATPEAETAEKLAALGVTSVVFAPCGNRSQSSYLQVMTENMERLQTVFPE